MLHAHAHILRSYIYFISLFCLLVFYCFGLKKYQFLFSISLTQSAHVYFVNLLVGWVVSMCVWLFSRIRCGYNANKYTVNFIVVLCRWLCYACVVLSTKRASKWNELMRQEQLIKSFVFAKNRAQAVYQ